MLLLAAVLVAGAMAVIMFQQGTSTASRTPEDPAEQMVLRLHDLPLGYFLLDFSEGAEVQFICEPIRPFKSTPALTRFVRRFSPEGCMGLYLRAYRVPGAASSPVVGTGALDAGSLEAAEAGFAISGDILNALVENERLQEVTPAATIGDATRLFHWKRVPRSFRNGHLGSFLVWRSGQALAAVFATAGTLEVSDRIVEQLAQRQQAHIESPTPYKRSERNTSEVLLDNPALTFPVYWLGRNFDPGHGLPVARLGGGGDPGRYGGALPRQKLHLRYSKNVYLNSWTSKGWKRFLETPGSRIMRTWHCTESTRIKIHGGHARVFAAHGRDFEVCPDRPPTLFFAFAYLHGTVTAVNFVSCPHCEQVPYGLYNSLRGIKEVVRGLRLRPEPVYPTG